MSAAPETAFLDTVEGEVVLFHAIARARPIGINGHFHAMAIWLALQKETQQRITVDDIWRKLRTLYDIDALNAIVSALSSALYVRLNAHHAL